MTAWYDKATFYHMYPLGMTGSPFANPYPVSDGAARSAIPSVTNPGTASGSFPA